MSWWDDADFDPLHAGDDPYYEQLEDEDQTPDLWDLLVAGKVS